MREMSLNTPLGELVNRHPALASVLEELRLDYCCEGNRALEEACWERQLDVAEVFDRLQRSAPVLPAGEANWAEAPVGELIHHIVDVHHGFLRRELPLLCELAQKMASAHGKNHPELVELHQVLLDLADELMTHMLKEEQVLFPWIERLNSPREDRFDQAHAASVRAPIQMMEHEHQDAAELLGRMRRLTTDFTAPADACAAYRRLLERLVDLERDLHRHIHEENSILFPQAIGQEAFLFAHS